MPAVNIREILDWLAVASLVLFSIYHVLTGVIGGAFSEYSLKFYKAIYGFQPRETEQLLMTFKPWGTLAFVVGLMGFVMLLDIERYSLMFIPMAALLVLRMGYRFYWRQKMYDFWKITPAQNWRQIIIQFTGAVLFILYAISRLDI